MKLWLLAITLVCAMSASNAQIFPAQIEPATMVPYLTHKVVVPPSPLKSQILFVGSTDDVTTTATYTSPAGTAKAKQWHDFIGISPKRATDPANAVGWVSVNHEMVEKNDKIGDGGGMTVFRLEWNQTLGKYEIGTTTLADGRSGKFHNVDFVNTVGSTGMNCGGIVSNADGRIWTAEEWYQASNTGIYSDGNGIRDTTDFVIGTTTPAGFPGYNGQTIKAYQNLNYMVEIDPYEAKAIRKQYNWGKMGYEGGVVMPDNKTVYLAEDGEAGASLLNKFVATTPGDFTTGRLYAFKQNDGAFTGTWVELDISTVAKALTAHTQAATLNATGFTRLEWPALNTTDGKIYITETGTDKPGSTNKKNKALGYTMPKHATDRATALGTSVDSAAYWDYYGRVLVFDPADNSIKTFLEAGPYINDAGAYVAYPDKHLSNPDGLSFLYIANKTFMLVQEDLNGSTFGRAPFGVTNRPCEMFMLDMSVAPTLANLQRLAITPQGAEITGAIATPDGKGVLFNSQHPSGFNEAPFNNSLTMVVYGFDGVITGVQEPTEEERKDAELRIYPNPTSREIRFNHAIDAALYTSDGQRVRVITNAEIMDIRDLASGSYYLMTADGKVQNVLLQK